ncbi:TIGR03985 family CRISPR-associated protein [Geminocystis sp. CENA526]|uniref:TIGR03985 family CRISPR-associated protein n=1 Tax=Geminocystis sp. CENA526 TaxID=1355871 RepID=UPI003D6FAE6B
MPEMSLSQEYPPLPANLWTIDIPKNLRYPKFDRPNFEKAQKNFFDNIKKAFRLYVEIMSFYDQDSDFYFINPQETFTQKDWRDFFNREDNQEFLQESVKDWLDTFGIKKENWLQQFQDLFGLELTKEQKEEILNLIPFDCLNEQNGQNGIRTFNNDFICLAKRGFLVSENKRYSKLSLEDIEQKLTANINVNNGAESTNIYDFVNNIKFDQVLTMTSENLKDQQRFFIKFQHIVNQNDVDKVEDIIYELRNIWEKEDIPLIKIKYQSSSQKQIYDALVTYPICLFYNQRGMYLTGYGSKPGDNYLSYYNYRLDHFQEWEKNKYIITVNWDDDDPYIHPELPNEKDEKQEQKSDDIYNELQKALGVDLHREIKTMLLRFPKDFHKYYIENTKRHDTFQRLNVKNLKDFWAKFDRHLKNSNIKTIITDNERELINEVIKKYPDDAYYVMDYRHGKEGGDNVEADVIMRLRSWGHNVEILAPHDLRKRMQEDCQKLWKVYNSKI